MIGVYYLDASAWAKRYLAEEGSYGVSTLFQSSLPIAGSVLGYIEVTAALFRRNSVQIAHRLAASLDQDWFEMSQLELSTAVLDHAATLTRTCRLRGADAIHLATALGFQESLQISGLKVAMVTYDRELTSAASFQMECISPKD